MGIVTIQVPINYFDVIIDMSLLVVWKDVPALSSMKDMFQNGLDTTIQGPYGSLGSRRRTLTMENFFFIRRWYPEDMLYALYRKEELRELHRAFGHPSVRALKMLMEGTTG